jgi:gluconokinase
VRLTVDGDGTGILDGPAYLACLVECLDELAAGGHLHDVELVTASAQWHSVLPVDDAGEALGPVLTWLDTRPEPPAGARGPADADAFHQRTGTWWHRCYWSVRLPWLRERTPGARFVGLSSTSSEAARRGPVLGHPGPACSICAPSTGTPGVRPGRSASR